jgi:hypothetical protein
MRTGRDKRTVDNGLQAYRTLLFVNFSLSELIAFCDFAGHRRRRRRFRHAERDDGTCKSLRNAVNPYTARVHGDPTW